MHLVLEAAGRVVALTRELDKVGRGWYGSGPAFPTTVQTNTCTAVHKGGACLKESQSACSRGEEPHCTREQECTYFSGLSLPTAGEYGRSSWFGPGGRPVP